MEFLWVSEIQSRVRHTGISPTVCLAAPHREHFWVQGRAVAVLGILSKGCKDGC